MNKEVSIIPLGKSAAPPSAVFTIGHSVRAIEAFLELLARHAIEHLVDVRRFPASRRHPHFGGPSLAPTLSTHGVAYTHLPDLGGRRSPQPGSRQLGWRNASFRAYADYMQTDEFELETARLLTIAERERSVVMCAESLPWRCHRSLIADALVARGVPVLHILDAGLRMHELPPFARVRESRVEYPDPRGDAPSPDLFAE
ncbi:MAG TPA: DUF488 domain-containing protein [Gemmatimonadaceae bacterium]|nr:DUF488 domain-containing protein [Gemmatimonadaceae bacterium]